MSADNRHEKHDEHDLQELDSGSATGGTSEATMVRRPTAVVGELGMVALMRLCLLGTPAYMIARVPVDAGSCVDGVAIPVDGGLPVALQSKATTDGLTVHASLLGRSILLMLVLLGADCGGPTSRSATRIFMLRPEDAFALPAELGRRFAADAWTYRFPAITVRLEKALAPYEVDPGNVAQVLAQHAARIAREILAADQQDDNAHGTVVGDPATALGVTGPRPCGGVL